MAVEKGHLIQCAAQNRGFNQQEYIAAAAACSPPGGIHSGAEKSPTRRRSNLTN